MISKKKLTILTFSLLLLFSSGVMALINPNFTPINLVEQSLLVVTVEFGTIGRDQKVVCVIKSLLKGKPKTKKITIDLSKAANASHAKSIAALIKESGENPGVFFIGKFLDSEDAEEEPKAKAFLHVSGKWVILSEGKGGIWDPSKISTHMEGTWAGGTDMLVKAVNYILEDADPLVPVNAGVSWEEDPIEVSTVKGKITSAAPVDLDGKGKLHLFIASDAGDRLFIHEDEKFSDVTAKRKLVSKSSVYVWLDLNGDGKLDLVSSDSKTCVYYEQKADGTFAKGNPSFLKPEEGVCKGLFAVSSATKGKPGLLLATDKGPVLYSPGEFPLKGENLGWLEKERQGFGKIGTCLVADFDDDRRADILQLFEKGSFFYKAKGAGAFEKAVLCSVALGRKASTATVGDYDADGLLDVFTGAEDGNQIWHNQGKAKFEGRIHVSGEIAYISKPEAIGAMTCDVNNDGKQDIYLTYSDLSPHIFFNRGFRSFGHAHMLDLAEKQLLPDSANGLQVGCIADFNDDGAQDMISVLKNGGVFFFKRESEEEDSLAIKVDLPLKGLTSGPLTVSGWVESGEEGKLRNLGAWNVIAGTGRAFIGLFEAGPCVIKWRLPGGKEQSKKIEVEDKPVRLLIK